MQLVDLLLRKGATVITDEVVNTPLHLAAENGHLEYVRYMFEYIAKCALMHNSNTLDP